MLWPRGALSAPSPRAAGSWERGGPEVSAPSTLRGASIEGELALFELVHKVCGMGRLCGIEFVVTEKLALRVIAAVFPMFIRPSLDRSW
jgi:hypothetical protein